MPGTTVAAGRGQRATSPVLRIWPQQLLLFALMFAALMLLHAPLLRLPYFWDEAGYYVPAAHDCYVSGTLIPQSTVSNAHPPLVMAWLALAWHGFGLSPVVTRTAMLAVAAFALLGIFRLAHTAANIEVAVATTMLAALYPVFFSQSSLAHLDVGAAAFTFWGLLGYVEDRPVGQGVWFSLAALTKETAILAPLALFAWEIVGRAFLPGNAPRAARLSEPACGAGSLARERTTCAAVVRARLWRGHCCPGIFSEIPCHPSVAIAAAGGLVRVSLCEDRIFAGEPGILSL